jgi:hypothetical protein
MLAAAAVAQGLHDWIDFCLKDFRELKALRKHIRKNRQAIQKLKYYLCTVLVNFRSFSIVYPSIFKHQPNIINELPRVRILSRLQFLFDCTHVHRSLDDVEVIRYVQ